MTISSQLKNLSIDSISSINSIDLSNITISNGGSGYAYSNISNGNICNTITLNTSCLTGLTGAQIGALTGASGTISTGFNIWKEKEEWVDCFPEWARIEEICEQYPGLKIAFEKFKTTYTLVKNHYDTPEDERPIP